jgi:threonine/homoserine/homoserine lactone efflux protein
MWGNLIGFCLFAALLTITPGADTALVLRASISGGAGLGMRTGAGVCTGLFVWGAAAGLGVTAVLAASRLGYDALRIAGAAWLVVRGIRAWRSAHDEPSASTGAAAPLGQGFGLGMLTNLLNPKVGIFYLSLLPQFIPTGAPMLPWSLLLTAIHATLGLLWFLLLTALVRSARSVIDRAAVRRVLQRICGTVMIGFGLRLALEAR